MAVITADEAVRGDKTIPLKSSVDTALVSCPSVKTVFVAKRTGGDVEMVAERDFFLDEVMAKESGECSPEYRDSDDFLFLLYTSGSTGKPKGIAHSTAGYLTYAALTHKVWKRTST